MVKVSHALPGSSFFFSLIAGLLLAGSACGAAVDEADPASCCWLWPAGDAVEACVLDYLVEHDIECTPVRCWPATIDWRTTVCNFEGECVCTVPDA